MHVHELTLQQLFSNTATPTSTRPHHRSSRPWLVLVCVRHAVHYPSAGLPSGRCVLVRVTFLSTRLSPVLPVLADVSAVRTSRLPQADGCDGRDGFDALIGRGQCRSPPRRRWRSVPAIDRPCADFLLRIGCCSRAARSDGAARAHEQRTVAAPPLRTRIEGTRHPGGVQAERVRRGTRQPTRRHCQGRPPCPAACHLAAARPHRRRSARAGDGHRCHFLPRRRDGRGAFRAQSVCDAAAVSRRRGWPQHRRGPSRVGCVSVRGDVCDVVRVDDDRRALAALAAVPSTTDAVRCVGHCAGTFPTSADAGGGSSSSIGLLYRSHAGVASHAFNGRRARSVQRSPAPVVAAIARAALECVVVLRLCGGPVLCLAEVWSGVPERLCRALVALVAAGAHPLDGRVRVVALHRGPLWSVRYGGSVRRLQ